MLDLFDLGHTDALHLTFAYTVAIENDPRRSRAIVAFERFKGLRHACLQIIRTLLAYLILYHTRGPVGCRRLIHRGSESQDRLLAELGVVENVHATNHRRLIHERQLVHGPGDATELSIHLDQHLGDDRSQILASLDGGRQDDLGRDWILGQEELLDVIVQVGLAFLAG